MHTFNLHFYWSLVLNNIFVSKYSFAFHISLATNYLFPLPLKI